VGPETRLAMLANFPYEISAADGFFLVSGATAGLLAERKLAVEPPARYYAGIVRRALRLYVIHWLIAAFLVAVHALTGRLRAPSLEALGGILGALVSLVTLRAQPTDYANILPLFVVFFLALPGFLELLRRGQWWLLLLASAGLWLLAQWHPSLIPLPNPELEPIAFSLAAWQFCFVIGLVLGYQRDKIRSYLLRVPQLAYAFLALTLLLFVLAQLQRRNLALFNLRAPANATWLLAKETFAPLHALYVVCVITAGYGLLQRWLARPGHAGLRRLTEHPLKWLETVGKKSLYCFVMHLPFAWLASAFHATTWPASAQLAFTTVAIIAVYVFARLGVLAQLLKV